MRNKRIGKIEYGKSTPRSPDDKVLWINTDNNSISRYIESTRQWVSVVESTGGNTGGNANTGLFEFENSSMFLSNNQPAEIFVKDGEGFTKAKISLDPDVNDIELLSESDYIYDTFSVMGSVWEGATWTQTSEGKGYISFQNAPALVDLFLNNPSFNQLPSDHLSISINDSFMPPFEWLQHDGSEWDLFNYNISIALKGINLPDGTLINTIQFRYTQKSRITVAEDVTLESRDDLYITAGGDDLFLRANDDIRFTAMYGTGQELAWRMDSDGQFQLPGNGYISNPPVSSESGNDTIKIVPDYMLESEGRFLIIEPTSPNHIHIRSGESVNGGSSEPELYIGGEETNFGVLNNFKRAVIKTESRPKIALYNSGEVSSDTLTFTDPTDYDFEAYDTLVLGDGTEFPVTSFGPGYVTVATFTFMPETTYQFARNLSQYRWNFLPNGLIELTQSNSSGGGVKIKEIKFSENDRYNTPRIYSYDSLHEPNELGIASGILKIADLEGSNYLQIEKSYTGTARIIATDDLALRAANDIILYPGETSDGVGKVYIGWGDDSMDTSELNEVATKGDIFYPSGANGEFTTATHTVTVVDGLITGIVALP